MKNREWTKSERKEAYPTESNEWTLSDILDVSFSIEREIYKSLGAILTKPKLNDLPDR